MQEKLVSTNVCNLGLGQPKFIKVVAMSPMLRLETITHNIHICTYTIHSHQRSQNLLISN